MVYVLSKNGAPLMPCSPRKARLLLAGNKAKVVRKTPFIIKLVYGSTEYRQTVVAGLDTGSTVVGCAAVANGCVVYQSETILRNDITGKLKSRSSYRRTRRGRKTRYRAARFDNRSASCRKDRLPPSLNSKITSHQREVAAVNSILPVSEWIFELAAFDIHKITNPEVTGVGYQQGALMQFYNVKQFVYARDSYRCQSGQKIKHSTRLHAHHKLFKSQGGADTQDNLITLCETCHADLHKGLFSLKAKTSRSKTKHATEMGVIKSRLAKDAIAHTVTYGYETKFKREQHLKLDKTHANDAIAICVKEGASVLPMANILIKRHLSKGDYQQTSGKRSQLTIPTGKLFGFRKGDKVATSRGMGFVKGKRSSGYFSISDIDGGIIHASEKVTNCVRLAARSTTQVEEIKLTKLIERRKEASLNKQLKKPTKAQA